MTIEDITTWLINWFEQNTDLEHEQILSALNENYFSNQWIDSFKFILFLNDIEEYFKISFSNDEFQGNEFSSINGLANLINSKRNV